MKDSGLVGSTVGGIPREQKMLQGHLPRVRYHQVYSSIRRLGFGDQGWGLGIGDEKFIVSIPIRFCGSWLERVRDMCSSALIEAIQKEVVRDLTT